MDGDGNAGKDNDNEDTTSLLRGKHARVYKYKLSTSGKGISTNVQPIMKRNTDL